MPIYEYNCSKCNYKFERLCSLSQASEDAPCPRCKKTAKRVLSTFSALSKNESGIMAPVRGTGSSCSSCSSSSCNTCGH